MASPISAMEWLSAWTKRLFKSLTTCTSLTILTIDHFLSRKKLDCLLLSVVQAVIFTSCLMSFCFDCFSQNPENPINARYLRAKEERDRMDLIREKKGRKILRRANRDREMRKAKEIAMKEKKMTDEIEREKTRETKMNNKTIRLNKVGLNVFKFSPLKRR